MPPVTGVEARLLNSAVASRTGRRTVAIKSLHDALHLAEPVRLIRPFVLADPCVGRLINDHAGGFGRLEAFSAEVRHAMFAEAPGNGGRLLTTREYDVLSHLASPVSFDEVAATLSVSVNTVKTHVRAIYAKLGVTSRRAAVSAARARGLA
ncbi:hypothetical protein BAY59_24640 [Prauserella coralliicola]|nr:hypothetical protein BAY59_24640 [Prauserella coralliicola]